ncbi:DNA topoisomerase I, mitochondrial-like isoform X2 [Pristis pectinata]|uniref:DNA topoisomerase I, mitochondrial-like isoform X2 n=1 Tax=Pristis pectinata TaxID=685728 RepID=UPI00223D9E86|nr:DNA topoisomerase I, mitochondrial-like isoform X2 [Pristis pectinata]
MSKDKDKDKALNKMDSGAEENKTSKKIPPPQNKAERELRSRKRKNNTIENSLNKMHKEDVSKMQLNKEIKIDQNEIYDKTEKKIKGNLLKRSSCQESFEDMLLGMDEQLKELCARKQKDKDKKYKKREKNSSNKPQDQKENSFKRPDNELEAGSDYGDVTEKVTTEKLTSKQTPEREDHLLEELNLNVKSEPLSSDEDSGNQENKQKKESEHAEDPSTKLDEEQDVDGNTFPVECTKKRIHCDVNSDQQKGKSKRLKMEEAEEEDEIPQTSYSCKGHGKGSVKRNKNVKNNVTAKEKKKLKKDGKNEHHLKEEEEKQDVEKWKWWEEELYEDGVKWMFLEHKGPLFAPEYESLPSGVNFYYNGNQMKLTPAAEEMATFFAKMLDHEYTTKAIFRQNFFEDWRQEMNSSEQMIITDLNKCDFRDIHQYFTEKAEARKALPKEEKQKLKIEQDAITEEYGYCIMDGHRERIANFKIEPPGLFRGRGDHPKMGKLKRRIMPEDVIINCSRDSKIPTPPEGHHWKEVRFDNKVTWLASWVENVQNLNKYVMLNPSSKLKGEKDLQKYEIARRLKDRIDAIQRQYRLDWKSREMKTRQRAVALYFIDKLALRAGNEKEEGETADTVGCCSLRVEHIHLHDNIDGQQCVVEFDFLGKDSIRYYNKVAVEKQVFKNLKLFMDNKDPTDDLFDRLNTSDLNKHLQELMEGLTAKVFRTYNASITLQKQLAELTNPEDSVAEKILSYNRANRAVAILCNHQRAPPKTFEKSMKNIQAKIEAKMEQLAAAKKDLKNAKVDCKVKKDEKSKQVVEKKKKLLQRLEDQLKKLEVQATDREENKQIALGTSKLNYLDPRITVAWCKKWNVPIEKIYNKTQREKFAWAIDMTEKDFEF